MKEVSFYLVCDLHINESTANLVKNSIFDIFDDMLREEVKTIILAGDVFDFRKSQTLITLNCFDDILQKAEELGITVIAIPGNHDKMSYTSEDSYLKPFRYFPSLRLFNTTTTIEVKGLNVSLIPFFRESDTFLTYFNLLEEVKENTVLVTHIAVDGVRNNDGSEVTSTLKLDLFKDFVNVFIGHYHDRQFIGENIIYAGSIMQRNFGETPNKGYTKVFTDGSYEFVDKEYQVFETIKLNYSESLSDDLEKLSEVKTSDVLKVRVILNGTKEELDSLKNLEVIKKLDSNGVVLKNNYESIEEVKLEQAEEFVPFTIQSVLKEWDEFAEENSYDKKVGSIILNKYLNV